MADIKIDIATGFGVRAKVWKNKAVQWVDFVDLLSEPTRTGETYKEFIEASKPDQVRAKDVGGYVGGYLRGQKRHPQNVLHRQLLTLDVDFANVDFFEDLELLLAGVEFVLHSTHKHSDKTPRYRLLIPLNREVTPDEYAAIGRKVAGNVDIDLFDHTTFETNRLMFWPSVSSDGQWVFEHQEGDILDADAVLEEYHDWQDVTEWPTAARLTKSILNAKDKQADPETKEGLVGAFCRVYDIHSAIAEFLSDKYEKVDDERYTYALGSTAGGLVTYESKFAFSHHGTDPASGMCSNAFDLVRLHKFGHLDEGNTTSRKSSSAMLKFVQGDGKVREQIARDAFSDFGDDDLDDLLDEEEDLSWTKSLEIDSKGAYKSSATNLNIILENDPRLKGAFKQNTFDGKRYIFKELPWRDAEVPSPVKNVDYAGIRNYIETLYGIAGSLKIEDAVSLQFEANSFNPLKEYLSGLEWDGEARVERMLHDYFGCPLDTYHKAVARVFLAGGVARVFRPGVKFDLVLTLVGKQGVGKSTFLHKLGKSWFSDTFLTVQGKEAYEQIQGAWLIEMAELDGLRKAEVETIKHFISKQEDTFRPAYGKVSETYKRQCFFAGTTNNREFLSDPTGNRRFLPVDLAGGTAPTRSVFTDLEGEVDQLWAEAVEMFRRGEPLYLKGEAEQQATAKQREHTYVDDRAGIVEKYLDAKLPKDWSDRDMWDRQEWARNPNADEATEERDRVCVAEVWCECLGNNQKDMDRFKTRDINAILKSHDGWAAQKSPADFGPYGKQRYYKRVKN